MSGRSSTSSCGRSIPGCPIPEPPPDGGPDPAGWKAIRVRPAGPDDDPRIADLSGQLGYPSTPAQIRARREALAGHEAHGLFVAEMPGSGVAGWIHVFASRSLELDPRAEVGGLVVDAAARGGGVGTALLNRAEAWAREQGLPVIGLRSNVIRTEAHEFYRRRGYTILKSQHAFRKALR